MAIPTEHAWLVAIIESLIVLFFSDLFEGKFFKIILIIFKCALQWHY